MKKYNWKYINESFFDELEDDLFDTDQQVVDALSDVILSKKLVDAVTEQDVYDYILDKFNILNFLNNEVPKIINTLLPKSNDKLIIINDFIRTTEDMFKYDIDSYGNIIVYNFAESDPNNFLGVKFPNELYYKKYNRLRVSSHSNVTLLFKISSIPMRQLGQMIQLTQIKIADRGIYVNIPVYAWDDGKPFDIKNQKIQEELIPELYKNLPQLFGTQNVKRIIDEINHVPVAYKMSQKDIDRMSVMANASDPKFTGYDAINNVSKKVARIAAWYIITFGKENVQELTDMLLLSWCIRRTGIIHDIRGLLNNSEIYIKDIVATIQKYKG